MSADTAVAADAAAREHLDICIVGHVDHGKSTLVGRLLNDTGSLPEGRIEAVAASSARRGMQFEWAFVMDALRAERDQGVTIDAARVWFRTARRDYVIIDAPGHKEFLRNMVTGAAGADAAVLVIDAVEGMREQSRRHGYLLELLGVRQVVVAINKMDLVDWDKPRFDAVAADCLAYLATLGVAPRFVVPVSARDGDNVARASANMTWYTGPAVTAALDSFVPPVSLADLPLRFPVQDVYKFDDRRIVAGRIESGRLAVGDRLLFLPSRKTARIATIEAWDAAPKTVAVAGDSCGVTLDEPIFVERGEVAVSESRPAIATHEISARIFWLSPSPLALGKPYTLKLGTARHRVTVRSIDKVIETEDLSFAHRDVVRANEVAEIVLHSRAPIALDRYADNARMGRFVLVDGYDIAGGGVVADAAEDEGPGSVASATRARQAARGIAAEARWRANGHRSGILWMTGLSGAGKSTLARALERQLHGRGAQVFVLDGDALRGGLNADLGFTAEDRAENVRRAGEVAALFADAGFIVIAALISPFRHDRERVRAFRPDRFHEVYVKAEIATCMARDPKGLYAKAKAGEIPEFTGITSPYEAPEAPELVIDTGAEALEESLARLLAYVDRALFAARPAPAADWQRDGSGI
jgi:bifunctional enzyme CysN/CysC